MIEVKDLVKQYGNKTALAGISFTVEDGQIVGLLGPNGAGKSTTMNIMTGYLSATSGTVTIDGYDILTKPVEAKARIGYLPEIPPLYVDMKVREYLMFVAKLKKVKRSERKKQVEHAMEVTGTMEYANRLIRFLSKGYKQRVGMAQALLGSPKLLILDEPTVGLDPKQIMNMRELIEELGKTHTVIISSHILSEISAVCDHIIIMDQGRVAAQGATKDLEDKFTKKDRLHLVVKGEEAAIESALTECAVIESFAVEPLEDGNYQVLAHTTSEEDLRDEIFFHFANHKLPVLSMELDNTSLEDIFLKLTDDEQETDALNEQEV